MNWTTSFRIKTAPSSRQRGEEVPLSLSGVSVCVARWPSSLPLLVSQSRYWATADKALLFPDHSAFLGKMNKLQQLMAGPSLLRGRRCLHLSFPSRGLCHLPSDIIMEPQLGVPYSVLTHTSPHTHIAVALPTTPLLLFPHPQPLTWPASPHTGNQMDS